MLQNFQVSSMSRQHGSVLSPPFLLQSVESRNYDNDNYKDFVIHCNRDLEWMRVAIPELFVTIVYD